MYRSTPPPGWKRLPPGLKQTCPALSKRVLHVAQVFTKAGCSVGAQRRLIGVFRPQDHAPRPGGARQTERLPGWVLTQAASLLIGMGTDPIQLGLFLRA